MPEPTLVSALRAAANPPPVDPLSVACTFCNQPAGWICLWPDDDPSGYHYWRKADAAQASIVKCSDVLTRAADCIAAFESLAEVAQEAREAWKRHKAVCGWCYSSETKKISTPQTAYNCGLCFNGKCLWDAKQDAANALIEAAKPEEGREGNGGVKGMEA